MIFKRIQSVLEPVDGEAFELMLSAPIGETVAFDKVINKRNIKFHKKYFALINYAYQHWEPQLKEVKRPSVDKPENWGVWTEDARIKHVNLMLEQGRWTPWAITMSFGVKENFIAEAICDYYFKSLSKRYPKIEPQKSRERFRKDLIILSGFYEQHWRVDGSLVIEPKSISFANMKEDQFEELYSNTINVVLKHVLQNYNKEQLDKVILELIAFDG